MTSKPKSKTEQIMTYQIEVPEHLWSAFKMTVHKGQKINDRIVELIEKDVKT